MLSDGITTFFSQEQPGAAVNQGKVYLYGGYAAIGDPNDPNLTAGLDQGHLGLRPGDGHLGRHRSSR